MALKLGIQTYQILTNDDEVCISSLSSILLAVIQNILIVMNSGSFLGVVSNKLSKNFILLPSERHPFSRQKSATDKAK